jgi:polyribonucleotide 5'-hydroxyl-kinase
MIIVIGNEKLTIEMQKLFAEGSYTHHKVTVLKIPRSFGVADLDMAYRDRIQAYQLKNYFYGAPLQLPKELESLPPGSLKLGGEASMELSLAPHSTVIAFDDIHIYRIGQGMHPTKPLWHVLSLTNLLSQNHLHHPLRYQ